MHGIGTRAEQLEKVRALLETVGLTGEMIDRYPHEFSGGQRQRIGIARALALDPKLVIADEPVSALDVSVRSQVLNLMVKLQRERDLTYIFISHDLSVVRARQRFDRDHVSRPHCRDRPADTVFAKPAHPYTRALIEAIPVPDPDVAVIGAVRARRRARRAAAGLAFHPRCPHAIPACSR